MRVSGSLTAIMGANSSSFNELSTNEYLKRLSSPEPINPIDPYWNQLLSFSFLIPINSSDGKLLEESTSSICKGVAINNCKSGNFGALIRNFLVRATELKASVQCEDNIFTWQTYNALFIIRSLSKYFVEHLSEELILQQFEAKPKEMGGYKDPEEMGPLLEELMNSLVEMLVDVPVMNFTYALHLEALNTLLVLMSIQMFQPQPAHKFTVYQIMMQGRCSIHACVLVKVLLRNFCNQEKCPPELYRQSSDMNSMVASVAASLWSVMTLGMGTKTEKKEEEFQETLLANQSLLFLLVLTNHCTGERGVSNPYREALFSFTNIHEESLVSQVAATFKMDYNLLFSALCSTLRDDQTTLLLYLLIHRNTGVKAFIFSRTNIDQLVMPLLKILYNAQDKNSHHIYMALIILLILSEDDVFNKAVHEITLKNIPWFKERPISEISLGGLLILVVIRTIQYNITRMRDKYLHTNCLAALANMSAQFTGLHPYVAQRMVSLFSQLSKKHARVVDQIRESAVTETDNEDPSEQNLMADLAVLEEVLRMVLEILNSCLAASLHHNPHLIYSLLYQRELFNSFKTHPTFQDILQNIDIVLSFFSARVEEHGKGSNLSPSEVLEVIKEGSVQFRRDKLKKFPDLKFKYVEEESPEEFFIPYVWSLVYHASNMYFNASRILLFSLSAS